MPRHKKEPEFVIKYVDGVPVPVKVFPYQGDPKPKPGGHFAFVQSVKARLEKGEDTSTLKAKYG